MKEIIQRAIRQFEMTTTRTNLTIEYEKFHDLGFSAGITLKGQWGAENTVRDFIRKEIMPAGYKAVFPVQVHGAEIEYIDTKNAGQRFQADGVFSNSNNICLTITTADCMPLIMAEKRSGYFAAVHVGWRSYLSGIVENAFDKFINSGVNVAEIYCQLGPAIGKCCFEIGKEVAILFEPEIVFERDGKYFADLRKGILNKLTKIGAKKSNVLNLDECTSCMSDRYYSYRRDKDTPVQMISYIYHNSQNGGGSF